MQVCLNGGGDDGLRTEKARQRRESWREPPPLAPGAEDAKTGSVGLPGGDCLVGKREPMQGRFVGGGERDGGGRGGDRGGRKLVQHVSFLTIEKLTSAADAGVDVLPNPRRLLEEGDLSIQRAIPLSGFGSAAEGRRAFLRRLGLSPSEYAERFRSIGSRSPRPYPSSDTEGPVPV